MCVGSLIKNPGGGLAPIGGYIVGKRTAWKNAAFRLTSPGLGREVGASLQVLPSFLSGTVPGTDRHRRRIKGCDFAANLYEKLGFKVVPSGTPPATISFRRSNSARRKDSISFCEGIQYAAPVDSFVTPEPWDMPGYDSQVIMAAGAFVSGASIELSADGPIKPPYAVYFQGGLTWQHAKFGILKSLQQCVKKGVVSAILCQK